MYGTRRKASVHVKVISSVQTQEQLQDSVQLRQTQRQVHRCDVTTRTLTWLQLRLFTIHVCLLLFVS